MLSTRLRGWDATWMGPTSCHRTYPLSVLPFFVGHSLQPTFVVPFPGFDTSATPVIIPLRDRAVTAAQEGIERSVRDGQRAEYPPRGPRRRKGWRETPHRMATEPRTGKKKYCVEWHSGLAYLDPQ
jgi:hypothetical protein